MENMRSGASPISNILPAEKNLRFTRFGIILLFEKHNNYINLVTLTSSIEQSHA
jgi:hypothetical protein